MMAVTNRVHPSQDVGTKHDAAEFSDGGRREDEGYRFANAI